MRVLDLFLYVWQTQVPTDHFGTGYCLMLFSLWCQVCTYCTHIFFCFSLALHSLESNLSGLLAGWAVHVVRACWLAVGKSSQGYLLCKETEKVVTVSFERKAGIRQMFAWCWLFVVVQELKIGLTPVQWVRHCHGLQLHIGSWADTVLEGRGKGYWVGKAWNRWHRAQSL